MYTQTHARTHTHTQIYESRLKSSKADQDTALECDQMKFTFQRVPFVVYTLLSLVLQCLDPIGQKVLLVGRDQSSSFWVRYSAVGVNIVVVGAIDTLCISFTQGCDQKAVGIHV